MKINKKVTYLKPQNFFILLLCSSALIGTFWIVCTLLQKLGCPFPTIDKDKFFDLGVLAFSSFSLIVFLDMIPFQEAEAKLSPGFYVRICNSPWSHFGLSILLNCFVSSVIIFSIYNENFSATTLSQMFVAFVTSMVFAVIFQRNLTLRYLYQSSIVYENLAQLAKEEDIDELWIDLYECTIKAIKDHRINDGRNFLSLMAKIYARVSEKGKLAHMHKDLQSLYKPAQDYHPLACQMEKYWPFLWLYDQNASKSTPSPLVDHISNELFLEESMQVAETLR